MLIASYGRCVQCRDVTQAVDELVAQGHLELRHCWPLVQPDAHPLYADLNYCVARFLYPPQ